MLCNTDLYSEQFYIHLSQAAGQSLDGVVIPTPSLPTPSSTPRLKVRPTQQTFKLTLHPLLSPHQTLLATPQFLAHVSPSSSEGIVTQININNLTTISPSSGASGDGDLLDFSQGPWVTMLQDLDMDGVCNFHINPRHE